MVCHLNSYCLLYTSRLGKAAQMNKPYWTLFKSIFPRQGGASVLFCLKFFASDGQLDWINYYCFWQTCPGVKDLLDVGQILQLDIIFDL